MSMKLMPITKGSTKSLYPDMNADYQAFAAEHTVGDHPEGLVLAPASEQQDHLPQVHVAVSGGRAGGRT